MINQLIKNFLGSSKQPLPSQPIPTQVSSVRLYSGKNRRIMKWGDGTFYDGQCLNGTILEGVGKLGMPNGDFYEGQFSQNQFHGVGKYTHADGSFYQGEWKNDIKHGEAKQCSKDGTVYTGGFRNGMKSGHGLMEWKDGTYFQGQFLNDQIHGIGKVVYNDGSSYSGQWVQNLYHGKGELRNSSSTYIGDFKKGLKSGEGVEIYRETGVKVEGLWENDAMLGRFLVYEEGKVRSAKAIQDEVSYLTDEEFHSLQS